MKLNWPLIVSLFVSFLIFGVFLTGLVNVEGTISAWEEKVAIVAFLQENTRPEEIDKLYEKIMLQDGVEEILYTSQEEALEKFLQEEALEQEINVLTTNPLPASLLIKTERRIGTIKRISETIASYPEIEDLGYGGRVAEELFAATSFLRLVSFVLSCALLLGLLVVNLLFFRVALSQQAPETKAKKVNIWMVRGGILVRGILEGLFTSLLALGILYGLHRLLMVRGANILFMDLDMMLGLIITGLVFGLLGTLFSWGRIR
jgi:cell division transport system permease protein